MKWGRIIASICLCGVLVFAWLSFGYRDISRVVFLDVGQGSGAYIRTSDGFEMLIDSGETNKTLRSLSRFRIPWDRYIDIAIASHADKDHVGMFPEIIRRYDIRTVISTPYASDKNGPYTALEYEVAQRAGEVYFPQMGKRYALAPHLSIVFLHPFYNEQGLSDNDASLVFILEHHDIRFLFTGDISRTIERQLVQQYGSELESDVLVVAHHGSRNSSDPTFIHTVSPRYAVISAGKDNLYGHPHAETLQMLSNVGTYILRTDSLGNIEFVISGDSEFEIVIK